MSDPDLVVVSTVPDVLVTSDGSNASDVVVTSDGFGINDSAAFAVTASAAAATATNQAGIATAQAANAAASAATATTQATNAAASATGASTSATNAAVSAAAAAASAGFNYTWSTSTASSDPGAGGIKGNNATVSAITAIYLSETDANANAIAALIADWGASTSINKAVVKIAKAAAPGTVWAEFYVTAAVTDNGAWDTLTVTYKAGTGVFLNTDAVILGASIVGDKGAPATGTVAGLTTHGVVIATGATSVGNTVVLTDGQIVVGATGADPTGKTLSGAVSLAPTGAVALLVPSVPAGRLTLTSGTAVMTADVAAATTVYYTGAQYVPLYNGTNLVMTATGGELSQATTDTTKSPAACVPNANYDEFLWVDGVTVRKTRSDYWKKAATVTMTIASPAVVTWTGNTFADGTPIVFTTSGALPTGLTAGTTYFVKQTTPGVIANTFNVAATVGGAAINTSGSQSGTHTGTAGDDFGTVARAGGGNAELDFTTSSGFPLNKNAITNGPAAGRGTYVGTIRTNGTATVDMKFGSAAAGGGKATLGVYNAYNQAWVNVEVTDSTPTWPYLAANVRATNNSVNNRIEFLSGLQTQGFKIYTSSIFTTAAVASASLNVGFALNSVAALDRKVIQITQVAASLTNIVNTSKDYKPVLGWNFVSGTEASDGSNSVTFSGNAPSGQALSGGFWM